MNLRTRLEKILPKKKEVDTSVHNNEYIVRDNCIRLGENSMIDLCLNALCKSDLFKDLSEDEIIKENSTFESDLCIARKVYGVISPQAQLVRRTIAQAIIKARDLKIGEK